MANAQPLTNPEPAIGIGYSHRPDGFRIHESDFTYLDQILEFNRCQRTDKRVSARAQALWYYLMYEYNKARWHCPLLLSAMQIRGELILNKKQFEDARKKLVDHGYILHVRNDGRKPAHYYIKVLKWKKELEKEFMHIPSDCEGHNVNQHFITEPF